MIEGNLPGVFNVLSALGITAVTATGAAYLLFKYLGDRWLSARFLEKLEVFKHTQQQEIERLRLMVNTAFDRTVKLHAYEYDVLPEVWEKLNAAFGRVGEFAAPVQHYPDLSRLSEGAFEHFLSESGLPEFEQDELRDSADPTSAYQTIRFWRDLNEAERVIWDFRKHFLTKGIFIQPNIKEKMRKLDDLMHAALREKEHEERYPEPREGRWAKSEALLKQGPALRDEIEQAIQARLWNTDLG